MELRSVLVVFVWYSWTKDVEYYRKIKFLGHTHLVAKEEQELKRTETGRQSRRKAEGVGRSTSVQ